MVHHLCLYLIFQLCVFILAELGRLNAIAGVRLVRKDVLQVAHRLILISTAMVSILLLLPLVLRSGLQLVELLVNSTLQLGMQIFGTVF